jgi:hypothetical protein
VSEDSTYEGQGLSGVKASGLHTRPMRFIVYSDGDNILLKPLKREIPEFKKLMKETQKLAAEAGLTEDDIMESIKAVRRKNNENRY